MIAIGVYHELKILRETSVGLYLGDWDDAEVLLPNKYCPEQFEIGDMIEVFVYRDHEQRLIATSLTPKIQLHQFACLQVSMVTDVGAFLDWGLEKELFVPFKKMQVPMQEGSWYVVYMDVDVKTDRLYATSRIEKYLSNEHLQLHEGDRVELLVAHKTDLGFSVIVNHKHRGLVYENEVFRPLKRGDQLTGYVKKVREENKLDISLQPLGFEGQNDEATQKILNALKDNEGFLPLTDKSAPEDIYEHMGLSKKAFKRAIGSLYKAKRVTLEASGIRLSESSM